MMNCKWILRLATLILLVATVTALSCANDDSEMASDASFTSPDSQNELCTNVDTYADGLSKESDNGWTFRFVQSAVTPPDKGSNTFTLEVEENGVKRSDLTVIAEPSMPHHDHGTFPPTFTATANDAGTYVLGPIDLFMSGRWEITFRAYEADPSTEAPASAVTFAFCLEG